MGFRDKRCVALYRDDDAHLTLNGPLVKALRRLSKVDKRLVAPMRDQPFGLMQSRGYAFRFRQTTDASPIIAIAPSESVPGSGTAMER